MTNLVMEKAEIFIYDNARLLDRRRFEYCCGEGIKEAVISALAAYQNDDGGFGNALEADIRCPQSQPVAIEVALKVMDEIGHYDRDMIKGIVHYLEKITLAGGGFPLALRVLNDYPHAPWWANKDDQTADINPTGGIVGYLLKQQVLTDFYEAAWFQRTLQYVWEFVEREEPQGYHDGVNWIAFLQHVPDRARAEAVLSTKIDPWLQRADVIERDPDADGYVQKVLDWAPTKQSYAAEFVSEDDVKLHLEHLIAQQQRDGGWHINFPDTSPAAGLEWRGLLTVDRLITLKSYGVI